MNSLSKMLGAGLGSAIAAVVVYAVKHAAPDMDAGTLQSVQFIVYTVLTMGSTYAAPPNT